MNSQEVGAPTAKAPARVEVQGGATSQGAAKGGASNQGATKGGASKEERRRTSKVGTTTITRGGSKVKFIKMQNVALINPGVDAL